MYINKDVDLITKGSMLGVLVSLSLAGSTGWKMPCLVAAKLTLDDGLNSKL
jgi:hypothetical protein